MQPITIPSQGTLSTHPLNTGKPIDTDTAPPAPSSAGDKAPWVDILHKPMQRDGSQKPGQKGAVGRYAGAVASVGSVRSAAADSDQISHDGKNE